MSYPTGSIPLTGAVGTTSISDTFATHYDYLGFGGMRSVGDNTQRDTVPLERRVFGMLVLSTLENKLYILANLAMGGVNDDLADNNNWIELNLGSQPPGAFLTNTQKTLLKLALRRGF